MSTWDQINLTKSALEQLCDMCILNYVMACAKSKQVSNYIKFWGVSLYEAFVHALNLL